MRRAALFLVLAASHAGADTPPVEGELAVLRDATQQWTYALVGGASLDALAAIPNSARTTCKVTDVTTTRSRLVCDPPPTAGSPLLALVANPRTLVFDDAGVRELRGDAVSPEAVADRANAMALTFPRTAPRGAVEVRPRPGGGSTRLHTRTDTMRVRGTERTVWISEVTMTAPASITTAAVFAPGVGPVLMCTKQATATPAYVCLRLLDDPVAPAPVVTPAPPKPAPQVTLARKAARSKTSLTAGKLAAKVLSAYLPGLERCYALVLATNPDATGTLALVFTVNAVGKTEDIVARSFAPKLTACASKLVASWRFPIPVSQYAEPLATRYELDFKLAGG